VGRRRARGRGRSAYAAGAGSLGEAVGTDAPFDYVVASHVIEHVPDLGWLRELRSILAGDGVVALAVPDQRRTFDALRAPTVLADVIDAHLAQRKAPSPRQVFDHYATAVSHRGLISWTHDAPLDQLARVHTEQEALERATTATRLGDYDDVHCWVFTPRSFCRLFAGLQRLALIPFSVASCSDLTNGEFYATLRPADPTSATTTPFGDGPACAAEAAITRFELDEARRELAVVRAERDAMQRSRSWRITQPLRAFNARRARRPISCRCSVRRRSAACRAHARHPIGSDHLTSTSG
jgi:Methyltransferase domain